MQPGWAAALLAGTFTLSACGGGGGATSQPSGTPDSTGGSVITPPAGMPSTPTNTSGAGVGTGTNSPAAPSGSTSTVSPVAMVVAYPTPPRGMSLTDLNDNGHAAGFSAYTTPLSVSAQNYHLASADNFAPLPMPVVANAANNNDAGVMVSTSTDAAGRVYHWRWNGATATAIPAPSDPSLTIFVVIGIDNSDRVAVVVSNGQGGRRIASVDASGRYTLMPTLADGSDTDDYFGAHVSNAGIVAGQVQSNTGHIRIFTWTPGQEPRAVFDDTDRVCGCSIRSVNDSGQVLLSVETVRSGGGNTGGTSTMHDPAYELLVSSGATYRQPAATSARATYYWGLNNAGQAVGSDGTNALLLTGGQLLNVNDYTNATSLGWRFGLAKFINNRKQIVGTGMFNGQERWFLLTLK